MVLCKTFIVGLHAMFSELELVLCHQGQVSHDELTVALTYVSSYHHHSDPRFILCLWIST